MATTKITSPDLFDLASLNTALKLPSGTTAERPTSPSTGEWRYNTTTNLIEFWDGGEWRDLQSEDIPPVPSENFNIVLYTGTGATQSITGVGFKPDFVWIKERDGNDANFIQDSTRGSTQTLYTNSNDSQVNEPQGVTSFDADGFTLGTYQGMNVNGSLFVAWCWKANGGTTSSNTDGTITSTVQVNTKAGFSVVTYNGSGNADTVGHGLGAVPKVVIIKRTNGGAGFNWINGGAGLSWTSNETVNFDNDGAIATWNYFNATAPTSTAFSIGTGANTGSVNDNAGTFIAYCFAEKTGYSKFDAYTGNGSANGPIVNTGFEPAYVLIKRTDSIDDWIVVDNKRNTTNSRYNYLMPNSSNAENGSASGTINPLVNFLSNGFQIAATWGAVNNNGSKYIYYAFAADQSAAPALPDSFANKLYAGTGSPQSISGLGFSPSLVWLKSRNQVNKNVITDVVRGANKQLFSDSTDAESTSTDRITSFDADGFTLNSGGTFNRTNNSGTNYVAWNWKANIIPTINTTGTIQSIVSANQASGFSVVKYVGNGSSGSTIGHGLSSAPEVIIAKNLQNITAWGVYVKDNVGSSGNPASERLTLQTTDATTTTTAYWGGTEPTSSVFTVGTENAVNQSGYNTIAYCFTSIAGFSKMGSYTGNGSSSGPTVTTGFQPDWIMIKRTDAGGTNWNIMDSTRGNADYLLAANTDGAEVTSETPLNTTSTGFVITESSAYINASGGTYIYMAFKENPAQYAIPSGEMGYLVAAGGGGSGADSGGGAGAGAGGLRTTYGLTSGGGASAETNLTLATGTYTITVGAGGAAYDGSTTAQNGVASTITGVASVSTVGGGAGGDFLKSGTAYKGNDGGSGGGSANSNGALTLAGGAGTANEGFAGGAGSTAGGPGSDSLAAGGGGGAAQVGTAGALNTGGNGGNGLTVAITGSNAGYAGGGGGGCRGTSGTTAGQGGNGGGGDAVSTGNGNPGAANTGGGAGGGRANGANGGSGVVVLRMNTSDFSGTTSGSPTISAIGSETILQYLASGSYVHNPSTAAGQMNYMVLAGGASGASNGGGGGSGGLRSSWYASGGGAAAETPITLSSGTYTITIGAGGALVDNSTSYQDPGNDGSATTISGNATVNTVGGGGGGSNNTAVGRNGGAGGGGGATPGVPSNGGSGTSGEGFDGGRAGAVNQPYAGAGGGGTGAVGGANSGSSAGAGGDGALISISGSAVNYGGGGGGTGGTPTGSLPGGAGGAGGGGAGGAYNGNGVSGTTNTGSGGGGSGDGGSFTSGAGGSGVVILRLITSEYSGTTTGSPTVTTVGTETVLTFTGSGTYVHS